MDIVLTPAEIKQFKQALISAFGRGDMEQVVFFGLEVRLTNIVTSSNFDKEVTDLVMWVNDNNQVEPLLKEAREKNPGNVKLRNFAEYMQARQPGQSLPAGQPADPLTGLKGQLIDELSKLPVTETPSGRSILLDGIPGADTLKRDHEIKRLDLELIITQLTKRGRLADGRLPVAKMIDNALPWAKGYEGEEKLKEIQGQLT